MPNLVGITESPRFLQRLPALNASTCCAREGGFGKGVGMTRRQVGERSPQLRQNENTCTVGAGGVNIIMHPIVVLIHVWFDTP